MKDFQKKQSDSDFILCSCYLSPRYKNKHKTEEK